MLKFERARSLTEAVTERLREEIIEGQLSLGEALSESKIAARYEVSRTPVREAFASLGLEGLIHTEPQQGTFVFTIDRDEYAKMSETRSILEMAALKLAAERAHDKLIKQWTRFVSNMTVAHRNKDSKRYSQQDGEFHFALFSLAGNPYLTAASQSFAAKMIAVRNRLGSQPEHMTYSLQQHAELLRLVKETDIKAAADLLESHIRFKGESFWAAADLIQRSGASHRTHRLLVARATS